MHTVADIVRACEQQGCCPLGAATGTQSPEPYEVAKKISQDGHPYHWELIDELSRIAWRWEGWLHICRVVDGKACEDCKRRSVEEALKLGLKELIEKNLFPGG